MADIMADGARWLRDQLASHASQEVAYWRGDQSVSVVASRGRTETDSWTAEGQDTVVHTRADDFIFDPSTLILGGVLTVPRKDDRIICPEGTFRVIPLDSEPCYRNSGAYNTLIRVHTKRIDDGA